VVPAKVVKIFSPGGGCDNPGDALPFETRNGDNGYAGSQGIPYFNGQ